MALGQSDPKCMLYSQSLPFFPDPSSFFFFLILVILYYHKVCSSRFYFHFPDFLINSCGLVGPHPPLPEAGVLCLVFSLENWLVLRKEK